MTQTIWYKIATISWWSYVAFFMTCYIAYLTTKPSKVPIKRLLLMPVMPLLLFSFLLMKHFTPGSIIVLASSVMIGTLLTHTYLGFRRVTFNPTLKALEFPGSWLIVPMLIGFFIAKFFYHIDIQAYTKHMLNPKNIDELLMFYGLLAGPIFGRATYALKKMT